MPRPRFPRALAIILATLSLTCAARAQTIIYVRSSAAPGGDGNNWGTAYSDIQSALTRASSINPSAQAPVQIWVAQGIYKPSQQTTTDPRSRTFALRSNVQLLGGFAGTEATSSQRTGGYESILSGDHAGDDTASFNDGNRGDNSIHVLIADGVSETAVLDGFTITGGYAFEAVDGAPNGRGGGLCANDPGSSPTVRACTFRGNYAFQGAAVSLSTPTTALVENCRIQNNFASDIVGGIRIHHKYTNRTTSTVTASIVGCVFTGNDAVRYGAAMQIEDQHTLVSNCISMDNPGDWSFEIDGTGSATFRNSIIWDNSAPIVSYGSLPGNAIDVDVDYCVIRGGSIALAGPRLPEHLNWGAHNRTDDPQLNADFTVDSGSPLIDGGTNAVLSARNARDFLGNGRIADGNSDGSAIIDIGPCEFGSDPFKPVLYVRANPGTVQSGLSWNDAFGGLGAIQSAMAYAAQSAGQYTQIWIAAGTYKPSPPLSQGGSRSDSFTLQNNLALYGGFNGTETLLSQRNIAANPTILSGDLNGDDNGDLNRADNSYHVVTASALDATARLDGVTVISGESDTNPAALGGGGALVNGGAPYFVNNTFRDNRSPYHHGGAVSIVPGSSARFEACFFEDNRTTAGGGALFDGSTASRFNSCTFRGNRATNTTIESGGGAVFLYQSNAKFTSCDFIGNMSADLGGAILEYSSPTHSEIVNCRFVGNTAVRYGGAITLLPGSSSNVIGSLFSANRTGYPSGGAAYARPGATLSVTNSAVVGNVATTQGAGLVCDGATMVIKNSLIWANIASGPTGNRQIDQQGSLVIAYSTVQDNTFSGAGVTAADPLFIRLPSPGSDIVWGTSDDDYGDLRLGPGSPAIDAGDSSALPQDIYDINGNGNTTEALPVDLFGFPRFVDDPAAANTGLGSPPVDRGCYESQVNCLTCPGPREWRSVIGGAFDFPGNWTPSVPLSTHDTLFNLPATYSITLPANQSFSTNSATFSAGNVSIDLGGGSLSQLAISDTSLVIGNTPNSAAALSITHGTLNAVDARIGAEPGSTGALTVGAGALLSTNRSLTVGFQGAGSMLISGGGRVFSRDASVGDQATSTGSVTVTGAGSAWNIPFFLIIDHGTVNVSAGASVTTGFGTYLFNDGVIAGDGAINGPVVNFGAIAPGNSPGTLTINGSYQQVGQIVGLGDVSGKLIAQASGAGSGQYDKLVVNGTATLGGGLSLNLLNNYVPAATDQLQVVSATGGLAMPFDVVFFPALDNTAASTKYFRTAYSGLRGPGSGSVTINLGNLATSPAFNTPSQYTLDNPPNSIAVGDLNGDGLADVAITIPDAADPTGTTGVVVVLMNQGGSGQNWQGFAPHLPGNPTTIPPIPVGINPQAAAIAKLELAPGAPNHLVIANAGSNSLSFLKFVSGTLQTVATQPTDPEPRALAAADFTGLGNASTIIAVACGGGSAASTGSTTMLANASSGSSLAFVRRNIPAPSGQRPIHIRPFNPDQDKDIDLAVAMIATDGSSDIVAVYANGLNSGAPVPVPDLFNATGAAATLPVGSGPSQAMSGRLAPPSATTPAGKKEDLVTVNRAGNSISVLVNTNSVQDAPTFAAAVDYAFDVTGTSAAEPRSGVIADLDGSGTLDLAVIASNPAGTNRVVKLLRNDSTTNLGITQVAFAQMPDLPSGSKPLAIVSADLDADGQTDLVTINSTSGRDTPNTVQVVRNALGAPATMVGACCNGAACIVQQATQCASPGQRFAGVGTACNTPGNLRLPCCKGDFDQSGALAVSDIFAFLNAWFAGTHTADTDDNGALAVSDIFTFLNAWFAGC
jgi:T5SS/PEP-CTERM-associated repeat protein